MHPDRQKKQDSPIFTPLKSEKLLFFNILQKI